MFYRCWLTLWLLTVLVDGQDTDPCLVHNHELLDDPWRSTAISAGTVYENDLLITEGWYRSVSGAGGTIPQTAPGSGKCGTKNPVWMDDTLPANGVTKDVKMCAVSVFSSCHTTWSTVRVKNCGSFYVYDLKQTPGDYGYCFGTETICPDGQSSETGFTPGCITFVDLPYTVTVSAGLEERIGPIVGGTTKTSNIEIKFEHNITFNDDNATAEEYLYDINWYINDNPLTNCSHAMVAYTNLSATRLKEECWRGTYKLNFLVRCEVRLRGLSGSSIGPFRSSESFKAGFTTDKEEYTVQEGSSIDILVTLTVPIGCVFLLSEAEDVRYDIAEDRCRTDISIQTPIHTANVQCSSGDVSDDPISFTNNFCGVRVSHNDWNATRTMKVYGASDNTVNLGSRSSSIRLGFHSSLLYFPAWNSASIPDILVVVEDADSIVLINECYSRNDPHMKTFDGKHYENQRLGEFVVYHNPQRLYWAHAMYQACLFGIPGATCNCGIAVRNNDDLFVANFCDAQIGWYTSGTQSNRYVEQSFCDDTTMLVKKNGNSYTITFPTGTKVSFGYYQYGSRVIINGISIKPSLADWKTSSGLCGYLDGDSTNDFRTKDGGTTTNSQTFALDWKINDPNDSLFADTNLPDASLTLPRYCKCRSNITSFSNFNDTIECSITAETTLCSYSNTDSFFKTCDEPSRRKRSTSHNRYRRSTSVQDVPSKFKIVFTPDANDEPEAPTWRNGWNETLANEACRTFIQNQNFLKKCEEVLEATANDNEEGIQSCISDIKLTGDTAFMQSTADSLARSCRMTAFKLENLTKTTAADGTAGQTVLDVMLDLDCSNNCSGNGVCLKGECQCFGDYEGADCSTEVTLPPIVSPNTNPGLCKRDVYACNAFHISGSNFAKENMTCKAVHFTITDGGYNLTSVNDTFPAQSIGGGFGCSCTLSDALRRRKRSTYQDDYQDRTKRSTDDQNPVIAEGFYLSVSNDGVTYSADIVVIIYDSWCQTCNTTTVSCVEFTSCITTTPSPTTTTTMPSSTETTSDQTTTTIEPTTTSTEPTTTEPTTTTTEPTTTTTEPTTTTTEPTTTTTEPTTTTTEPTTTTTEPTTTTTEPTTTTTEPTTTTTEPTTTTTEPTTTTTEPTTTTTEPTTTEPTTTTTEPTTTTTEPTTTTTEPTTTTTEPTTTTTEPTTTTTEPTTTTTEPTTTTTEPTTTTTEPTTTTTEPTTTTTEPTTTTTEPTTTTTEPTTTTTEPTTTEPTTTTTEPTTTTTEPTTTTTEPTTTTTEPTTTTTEPTTTTTEPTTTTTEPTTTTTEPTTTTTEPTTTTTEPTTTTTEPTTTTTEPTTTTTEPTTTEPTTTTTEPTTTTTEPTTTEPTTTTTEPTTTTTEPTTTTTEPTTTTTKPTTTTTEPTTTTTEPTTTTTEPTTTTTKPTTTTTEPTTTTTEPTTTTTEPTTTTTEPTTTTTEPTTTTTEPTTTTTEPTTTTTEPTTTTTEPTTTTTEPTTTTTEPTTTTTEPTTTTTEPTTTTTEPTTTTTEPTTTTTEPTTTTTEPTTTEPTTTTTEPTTTTTEPTTTEPTTTTTEPTTTTTEPTTTTTEPTTTTTKPTTTTTEPTTTTTEPTTTTTEPTTTTTKPTTTTTEPTTTTTEPTTTTTEPTTTTTEPTTTTTEPTTTTTEPTTTEPTTTEPTTTTTEPTTTTTEPTTTTTEPTTTTTEPTTTTTEPTTTTTEPTTTEPTTTTTEQTTTEPTTTTTEPTTTTTEQTTTEPTTTTTEPTTTTTEQTTTEPTTTTTEPTTTTTEPTTTTTEPTTTTTEPTTTTTEPTTTTTEPTTTATEPTTTTTKPTTTTTEPTTTTTEPTTTTTKPTTTTTEPTTTTTEPTTTTTEPTTTTTEPTTTTAEPTTTTTEPTTTTTEPTTTTTEPTTTTTEQTTTEPTTTTTEPTTTTTEPTTTTTEPTTTTTEPTTTTTEPTTTTTEPTTTTTEPTTTTAEPTTTTTESTTTTNEATTTAFGEDLLVIPIVTTGLEERIGTPPNTKTSGDFKIFEMKFMCTVTFGDDSVDPEKILYDITWYIDDAEVMGSSRMKLTHAELATTGSLREENWRGMHTLGFEVKCGIALRSSASNPPGSVTFSGAFHAGIQTDMPEYVVTEDESFDIQVRLTVPIGCSYPLNSSIGVINDTLDNQCKLPLRIQTHMENTGVSCSAGGLANEPISFGDNGCGLEFNHTHWEHAQVIRVYGASDNQVNMENRNVSVLLTADTVVTHHNAWNSASSKNISVSVVDADVRVLSSICESYNDPHLRTFDGRSWENQRLGEFVLFRNNHYRVHAMYQTCVNGVPGATCNCGVAIRSNDALVVANFCDSVIGWSATNGTSSNQYIEGSFCDDAQMTIDNDGNTYKVTLPTGTQISFNHVTENTVTLIGGIAIKPSLADWQTSSGLCGFLDGDMTNDFRTRDGGSTSDERTFALDWKITETVDDVSLFGDVTLPDQSTALPKYCKCRNNAIPGVKSAECNINTATTLCSGSGSASIFRTCDEPSRQRRSAYEPLQRHKRASGEVEAVPKIPIVLDSSANSDPTPLAWRNGWDESSAEVACTQFLKGQKFLQKCEEVLEKMVNETAKGVKSCVKDIKLIGDNRFMQSTADTLSENCRMTAVKLENLTRTSSPAGVPGKSLLDEMLDLDCRNNCSRNGICTNGRCECIDDFEGSDCSIRRSLPPIVSPRTNPGLCQRNVYTCNTFYVSGSNFAQENVTCRAVHFTVDASTHQLTSKNETFPAVPMSGGIGCSCSLPQSLRKRRTAQARNVLADGFYLSVSNDGVTFSDDLVVLVYDSTCYSCDTTSLTCTIKSSCQSTSTALPATPTTTSEDDQHRPHGGWNTGLIVSAAIGGIGGIVVVLVLTKVILTFKESAKAKKKRQYASTREEEENYYRRSSYWEHSKAYPSIGRSSGSSRIHTRFY